MGTLGPIDDESVVNVNWVSTEMEGRKDGNSGMETTRKTKHEKNPENDSENYLRTQNGELNGTKLST